MILSSPAYLLSSLTLSMLSLKNYRKPPEYAMVYLHPIPFHMLLPWFTSTCNLRLSPCGVSFWEVRVTYLSRMQPQSSSVQSLSHVWLFATPWTTACQASLSITDCRSLPKPMSIESVMPSNHLILCHPLLLLPSIFPRIRVFSNESALCISTGVSASTSVLPRTPRTDLP